MNFQEQDKGQSHEEVNYKKNRLIETICEIQFQNQAWDLTIPGLIYNELQKKYPIKKEVKGLGFRLQANPKGLFSSQINQELNRMQFTNNQNDRLYQIGNNLLAINKLKPYISWDDFKEQINDVLDSYINLFGLNIIKKIGLRYINNFNFSLVKEFDFDTYFNFSPSVPGPEYTLTGDIFLKTSIIKNTQDGVLNTIFATNYLVDKNELRVILDFDFINIFEKGIQLTKEKIMEILEVSHNEIINVFENWITDSLRDTIK